MPFPFRVEWLVVLACVACGSSHLSVEELKDPQTCAKCHPDHYRDWSGSMHAYAAEDPVFRAMNQRGQRETNGALGTFCVNCHAPLAVRQGATTDGLNLDSVDPKLRGITCFFCHTVDDVTGTHNNPLHLANDSVMRGPFSDPMPTSAHGSIASKFQDRDQIESASMCGACHDIVGPHGAALERTFAEWQASVFAKPPLGATCGQCHMSQSQVQKPASNVSGSPPRRTHNHTFAGIDTALTDFPEKAAQEDRIAALLATTMQSAVCVALTPMGAQVRVILDNVGAGHSFPSGSTQDRRLWVELEAFKAGQRIYANGVVDAGVVETDLRDPGMWMMRDCLFGTDGGQVSMFWEMASYEGNALPAQLTFDKLDPRFYESHLMQTYPAKSSGLHPTPDRVAAKVWLRPMGLDVLNDLVASGDLAPEVRDSMTARLVQSVEWTPSTATQTYVDSDGSTVACISGTNLNGAGATVPAVLHTMCAP